jgi:nucleotide-binding universal stress UspA family protein
MSGIVVGVDGSEHAQRALEWAMNEAAVRNAPLIVLTVHQVAIDHWGLAELHYPEDVPAREKALGAAQQAVDKAAAQLGGPTPPSVEVRAVNGIPAEVLIAESRTADLLVVGTRGGGFEMHAMGSVSNKVGHHAECPVVIVPRVKHH